MNEFREFWGKAQAGGEDGPGAHPLVWHLLDVAAVFEQLIENSELARGLPTDWRGMLVFLTALHDVGKFTRSFQALVPEHWPSALGLFQGRIGAPRHDTLGWMILSGKLRTDLEANLPGWGERQLDALLRAVTGHHGRPPEEDAGRLLPEIFCPTCEQAVRDLLSAFHSLLAPPTVNRPTTAEAKRLSWLVAGLVNLADWIGSANPPFHYEMPDAYDLPAYWTLARERAREAVAASGLLPATIAPAGGLRALFPDIHDPSPMQAWAETVALPAGPGLVLIEDATGSGKTEAALLLAHRMMAEGRAGGLFFALPTMATANAMFGRLGTSYRQLFAAGATPSLVLAHGRRALDDGFRSSILRTAQPTAEVGEDGAEPAGPSCAAWIADDRRKAFLAEIGAGTIDQALLATLPSRHAALRLLGLSRRVLIVDEAHAYDPYMREELCGLLRFQAALGGSAIVLSATLPHATRRALADAFAEGGGGELVGTTYPLATVVSAAAAAEYPVALHPASGRRVAVRRLPDAGSVIDAIAAAPADAAIAWVRNTVDDAMAASDALRERGREVILFHARFAMADRLAVESAVLARFGKEAHGPRAGIVVATQVIEQSLDLDFDMMVSDLAPIDLLIQRAGRLWRHERKARPVTGPELLVLSPEPVADPQEDWLRALLPKTEAVYRDPALLWRSARILFAAGAIVTPTDMRALIEPVYAKGADVPVGLQDRSDRAAGKDAAAAGLGRINVLNPEDGYCRGNDGWEDDVQTPTRLSEGQVLVRLARVENGRVVPWADADTPARAWVLSEVSMRANRLGMPALDPAMGALVEVTKEGWPRYLRDTPVLVLVPNSDGSWRVAGYPSDSVDYHPKYGLRLPPSLRD
ncbi:MAG: CRISPR-associated helicase Cas3' [Acidobacteriota bacterium]